VEAKAKFVRTRAAAPGIRRCGVFHGPGRGGNVFPVGRFTEAELDRLEEDPDLVVDYLDEHPDAPAEAEDRDGGAGDAPPERAEPRTTGGRGAGKASGRGSGKARGEAPAGDGAAATGESGAAPAEGSGEAAEEGEAGTS
jgi:hypothetical protein